MVKKYKHPPGAGPVPDGSGPECPRCGTIMQRYVHGPDWKPSDAQAYYFLYWYNCEVKACRTQQVNPLEPEAKAWLTPPKPTAKRDPPPDGREEIAAMEAHFRSITPSTDDPPHEDTATIDDSIPPWEPLPHSDEVGASELKPLQIRVTDDWLDAVDDWRRRQKRIPSVAEAIRQLVSIAVETQAKRHGSP